LATQKEKTLSLSKETFKEPHRPPIDLLVDHLSSYVKILSALHLNERKKCFRRKRKKLLFDSILRANYELDASSLDIT
jgi:hypothetical protein